MRHVVILGSTGSIGCSTLSVLAMHSQQFEVLALTAASQTSKLLAQCLEFRPRFAAMLCPNAAAELKTALKQHGCATEVMAGPEALNELAAHPDADIVVAAIVGAAGLLPTLAAVEQGKTKFVPQHGWRNVACNKHAFAAAYCPTVQSMHVV